MINYMEESVCTNEEKLLEDDKNEENCSDIHSEVFDTACDDTDTNQDNSIENGVNKPVYPENDTVSS